MQSSQLLNGVKRSFSFVIIVSTNRETFIEISGYRVQSKNLGTQNTSNDLSFGNGETIDSCRIRAYVAEQYKSFNLEPENEPPQDFPHLSEQGPEDKRT